MRTLNITETNDVAGGTFGLFNFFCKPTPRYCAPAPKPDKCAPAPKPRRGC